LSFVSKRSLVINTPNQGVIVGTAGFSTVPLLEYSYLNLITFHFTHFVGVGDEHNQEKDMSEDHNHEDDEEGTS
jgi:hypothetical protein